MKRPTPFIFVSVLFLLILFGGGIYHGQRDSPKIALTFDDGPGSMTPQFLELLREKDVPATFFIVGEHAVEHPDILKMIAQEGHDIGVHGFTHKLNLGDNEEIENTVSLITNLTGTIPEFYRPPHGVTTLYSIHIAKSYGLRTIIADVFTLDYKAKDSDSIVNFVLKKSRHGSIILLHDGPENRTLTLHALPIIIDQLREEGYKFVPLSQLLDR